MARLNMVIADMDSGYLDVLVGYLNEKHTKTFKIFSFTDRENLKVFLDTNNDVLDILLVDPVIYFDELSNYDINTVIILSGRVIIKDFGCIPVISKYQPGEALASRVLNIFSDRNAELLNIGQGDMATKLVGVYSPTGGTGKTCIALGCSMVSAGLGKRAFYINFEDIPSLAPFVEERGEFDISHAFYYIKSKNKNLSMKIEGIRSIDTIHGFHYFNAPENIYELSDLTPEDYIALLNGLKSMKVYDYIFIDMSSPMDAKNIKILEACDEILLLTTGEKLSILKAGLFFNSLPIIEERNKLSLSQKMHTVLNKAGEKPGGDTRSIEARSRKVDFIVPWSQLLSVENAGRLSQVVSGDFGDAVCKIVLGLGK